MSPSKKSSKEKKQSNTVFVLAVALVVVLLIWQHYIQKNSAASISVLPSANNSGSVSLTSCNVGFPGGTVPLFYRLTSGGIAQTQLTGPKQALNLRFGQSKFVTIDVNDSALFKITNTNPILGSPSCVQDALDKRWTYKLSCVKDNGTLGLSAYILLNCNVNNTVGVTSPTWFAKIDIPNWWDNLWNWLASLGPPPIFANGANLPGYNGTKGCNCLSTNELPGKTITIRNDDADREIDQQAVIQITNFYKTNCGSIGVCTTCDNAMNPKSCTVCCGTPK